MPRVLKRRKAGKIAILGLTGSIAMGKTVTAGCFAFLGFRVFDTDQQIHQIVKKDDPTIKKIKQIFPEAFLHEGRVNQKMLREIVLSDGEKLSQLEEILHPVIWKKLKDFTQFCFRNRQRNILFDIPLLFETKAHQFCNFVYVVTTSHLIQNQRLKRRFDMKISHVKFILKRQLPDPIKRRYADKILYSGLGRGFLIRAIKADLKKRSFF